MAATERPAMVRKLTGSERRQRLKPGLRLGHGGRQSAEEGRRDDHETDDQEGAKLDDRLHGDREHQPVLMLRRVDMAGAEGDGEARQHECHDQRQIAEKQERSRVGAALEAREQRRQRCRNRLELQGDIGDDGDERDEGDGRRHELVLAVAGGDQIGDRGRVLRLRETRDAGEEPRAKKKDEDRPHIDAEKGDAIDRGEIDRAVDGPRGAIDAQAKRSTPWRANVPKARFSAPIAILRDHEEEAQIDECREDDRPAGDHLASPHVPHAQALAPPGECLLPQERLMTKPAIFCGSRFCH